MTLLRHPRPRLVVIGNGMAVTVVHLMPSLMERQLDPVSADLLARTLAARGVTVLTGASTRAVLGEHHVRGVALTDGRELAADLVVMAAGVRPSIALARAAGLESSRGVQVDHTMRTSDPAIASAGMIIRKRPMNMASPSVVFQNGTLADRPANALPLLPVADT